MPGLKNLSEVKSAGAGSWQRPQWSHLEQCADWWASFRPRTEHF
jgi:hypothetical protein